MKVDADVLDLEELVEDEAELKKLTKKRNEIAILIDRLIANSDEETIFRLGDSVQTAYFEGDGVCWVEIQDQKRKTFSREQHRWKSALDVL